MSALNRRGLIGAGLMLGAAGATTAATQAQAQSQTQATAPSLPAGPGAPQDQDYWRAVAAQYDVTREVIQLENGNYGMMARPVLEAYKRHLTKVNTESSFYTRRTIGPDTSRARARVAANLGVDVEEITFTRGATESLMTLIQGYNKLRPGDQVMYADLDYDSTQNAFHWLQARRGVELVTFDLPQQATHQNLLDAYEAALANHPKVRLLLLTHVGHRTGLVMPVPEIMEIARRHNVDVVLDVAHSWGQLDFKLPDLKADFVGLTCQKWIGAPIGVGVVYIRRDRIHDIDIAPGNDQVPSDRIHDRVHTGTSNFAGFLSVTEALDFHEAVGARAKEMRLRHLRDRWAEALRDHGRIEILTPQDPRLTCGITSFRLKGKVSEAENRALSADLLKRFNIFTVERSGTAIGSCVRVTPGIFTQEAEIDHLVDALKTMA
ncbi:MAG: aminotransferase class V-fold PLP-dependent enzyme [Caulobacteraceae bacterium]